MENKGNGKENQTFFTEWLEKLQQESWQLELLISGFAIVGIYSTRTIIADFQFYRYNEFYSEFGLLVGMLTYVFKTGWLIFFINLIVHVILRGLWIGTIGLRYVSSEIDYDNMKYADRFTNFLKYKVGSYDNFIERLEKFCSVLFAFTFLLFLFCFSLCIFMIELIFLVVLFEKLFPNSQDAIAVGGLLALFFLLLGVIVFIDLISLGALKKIKDKRVSTVYFYIYRFISFITLSFLYRPLLYNFIDNSYTRKLFYFSVPYIFIVMGGYNLLENNPNPYLPDQKMLQSKGLTINDYYYDDLRNIKLQEFPNEERKINKQLLKIVSLQEFNINGNNSAIFIRLDKNMVKLVEMDTTISPFKNSGLSMRWWFNREKIEDKTVLATKSAKEKELSTLINERKQLKKEKDVNNEAKIDSLNKLIAQRTRFWEEKINTATDIHLQNIQKKYLENISLYIDDARVELNQCFYYTHPHFKEQGLKCFFDTDTLSTGIHFVKFIRNVVEKDDEIEKDSLILPINKH